MTLNTSSYYDQGYQDGLAKAGDRLAKGTAHVEYIYHKHLDKDGNVVSFSNAASFKQSSAGGCFTKAIYKVHSHSIKCGTKYTSHTHNRSCATQTVSSDIQYHSYYVDHGDGGGHQQCPQCGYTQDADMPFTHNHPVTNTVYACGNSPLNSGKAYNCGKTAGTCYSSEGVDYYALSCTKTATSIDSGYIVWD